MPEVTASPDILFVMGRIGNLSVWTFSHRPQGSDETVYLELGDLITYSSNTMWAHYCLTPCSRVREMGNTEIHMTGAALSSLMSHASLLVP